MFLWILSILRIWNFSSRKNPFFTNPSFLDPFPQLTWKWLKTKFTTLVAYFPFSWMRYPIFLKFVACLRNHLNKKLNWFDSEMHNLCNVSYWSDLWPKGNVFYVSEFHCILLSLSNQGAINFAYTLHLRIPAAYFQVFLPVCYWTENNHILHL